MRNARFERVRRDGVAKRSLVVGDLTFTLQRSLDDAEPELPSRQVDVERIRRALRARGVAQSIQELEGRPHCR